MFRKVTAILDMRDITMTNEEWSFAAIAVEASHNDYEKRKSAARCLGRMRSNRALRLLLLLLKDSSAGVRFSAALALGKRRWGRWVGAVPALIDALGDHHPRVRAIAARSLGIIGDSQATPYLLELCGGQNADVRGFAIRALGDIGDSSVSNELARFLADPTWETQWDAAQTLLKLKDERGVASIQRLREDPRVPDDLRRRVSAMVREFHNK